MVGLTGGIASGKTTVAAMFAELGATVLNADRIGHEIAAPGEPALAEIVAEFGPEVLRPDGTLDRKRLAERVFASSAARATLNRITHPRIRERVAARLRELAAHPPDPPIVLVEAALLVEAGWQALVDRILVVAAQPSTQVARLMAGPGLSRPQAEARVRAQLPLSRKLRAAHWVVSGELPLSETRRQVEAVWAELLREAHDPDFSGHPGPRERSPLSREERALRSAETNRGVPRTRRPVPLAPPTRPGRIGSTIATG